MGVNANFLAGGIADWTELGLPTHRNIGISPSKWITREHPKIDRIACPWLIRRFIHPNAEFIYVPKDQVLAVARQTGATPYDIDGVEFTHEGDRCSFDAIMRIYDIQDPALDRLATIVRGADTSRPDLALASQGRERVQGQDHRHQRTLGKRILPISRSPDGHRGLEAWSRDVRLRRHGHAQRVIAGHRLRPSSNSDPQSLTQTAVPQLACFYSATVAWFCSAVDTINLGH
jgi:hypothetical protein